jgi:hypothetical protein
VPRRWEENPELGKWVAAVRSKQKRGQLDEKYIHQLDKIGFIWDLKAAKWEEMYLALSKFKETHGHCDVPRRWEENPELGKWVAAVRGLRTKGNLHESYISQMDKIGFIWDLKAAKWEEMYLAKWEEMYLALSKFKETHGHCDVPRISELGKWVAEVRGTRTKGQLSENRIRQLNEIGFLWNRSKSDRNIIRLKKKELSKQPIRRSGKFLYDFHLTDLEWEIMFRYLYHYYENHGHCNVPSWYKNSELATWVRKQRNEYKNGNLRKDHKQRLDEIEFQWNITD